MIAAQDDLSTRKKATTNCFPRAQRRANQAFPRRSTSKEEIEKYWWLQASSLSVER
jgi:hypothetical protein